MVRKAEKLLERMRKSKSGWRRQDLDRLYKGFGFTITPGGSHDRVSHPDFPHLINLPRHNKLLVAYVAEAVKNIDRLKEIQKQKEEQKGEDYE